MQVHVNVEAAVSSERWNRFDAKWFCQDKLARFSCFVPSRATSSARGAPLPRAWCAAAVGKLFQHTHTHVELNYTAACYDTLMSIAAADKFIRTMLVRAGCLLACGRQHSLQQEAARVLRMQEAE